MKTEFVYYLSNEAIYQLKYYNNLNLTHKKNIKTFLILIATINVYLVIIHVC